LATGPVSHRDPFDRLLAVQGLEEDLSLVTGDPIFLRYGGRRIWR
jgi:PIN domain nuclease of toxin-antitoxin system